MPNTNIIEIFQKHNIDAIDGESSTYFVRKMKKVHPEKLWKLLEEFTDGQPIGMDSPNEKMHRLTISYVLLDIYENNKETVTQENVDAAFKRAGGTAERCNRGSSTCSDDELPENAGTKTAPASDDATTKPTKKRKRIAGLMALVTSLVADNPKATPAEIVTMVQERQPEANANTVKVYCSKARKEQNISGTGKRGRKPSKLYPTIKKAVNDNPTASKEEVLAMVREEIEDAKESTVAVYFSKARKELNL